MLYQYWANVADGGPALKQHWFNASCVLGWVRVCIKMASMGGKLQVVGRGSETQLQVGENLYDLIYRFQG